MCINLGVFKNSLEKCGISLLVWGFGGINSNIIHMLAKKKNFLLYKYTYMYIDRYKRKSKV